MDNNYNRNGLDLSRKRKFKIPPISDSMKGLAKNQFHSQAYFINGRSNYLPQPEMRRGARAHTLPPSSASVISNQDRYAPKYYQPMLNQIPAPKDDRPQHQFKIPHARPKPQNTNFIRNRNTDSIPVSVYKSHLGSSREETRSKHIPLSVPPTMQRYRRAPRSPVNYYPHILLNDIPPPPPPQPPSIPPVSRVTRGMQTDDVFVVTMEEYDLIRYLKDAENNNEVDHPNFEEQQGETSGNQDMEENRPADDNVEWVEGDNRLVVAEDENEKVENNAISPPKGLENYFIMYDFGDEANSRPMPARLHQYQNISYHSEMPTERTQQDYATHAPSEANTPTMYLARRQTMPTQVPTARQRPPLSETPHDPQLGQAITDNGLAYDQPNDNNANVDGNRMLWELYVNMLQQRRHPQTPQSGQYNETANVANDRPVWQ